MVFCQALQAAADWQATLSLTGSTLVGEPCSLWDHLQVTWVKPTISPCTCRCIGNPLNPFMGPGSLSWQPYGIMMHDTQPWYGAYNNGDEC